MVRMQQTRAASHDSETLGRGEMKLRECEVYKGGSESDASDDSHISATPPRERLGMPSALTSCKSKKMLSDSLAKALPKITKSNAVAGRLENDAIFLGERSRNLQILRKGSKKVTLRNQEKHSKKHVTDGIKLSDRVNDGDALVYSSKISELGFSVKLQRPGRHAEEGVFNTNDLETVPPGFFSSCIPSSMVNPACKSMLRRMLDSCQDSQEEPLLHTSFSKAHASLSMSEGSHTEEIGDNNPDFCEGSGEGSTRPDNIKHQKMVFPDSLSTSPAEDFDNVNENAYSFHTFATNGSKQREQEKPCAISLASRGFCTAGDTPDLSAPQKKNAEDQNLGESVLSGKTLSRPKQSKHKDDLSKESNSWSNPKFSRKATRIHQNMIMASTIGTINKSIYSSKKKSQGGNFVKLNLNGKGSRLRKFVNKGSKRKAVSTSSGRTFHRRKRIKIDDKDEGNNLLHEIEDSELIDVDENGNSKKELVNQSVQRRGCQSNDKTDYSGNASEEFNSNQTKGQNSYDQSLLKDATENALREPSHQNLLKLLKISHGFDSFRTGQLETVKRIIAKQSTMLVSPTGSGKSLCYQLPALVLPGVTLVISPLVALMVDQLKQLPAMISGSLLTSSQSGKEMVQTLDQLHTGAIKVLFISPERLLNESFLSILENIPLISLAVVDEAHCLSEWSHNFRPSYFRLGTILRKRLAVQCVLAMTATATKKTLKSILHSLEIAASDVVQVSYMRENLKCSVSLTENKLKDLLSLMKTSPFPEAKSIIIYCKFQSDTVFVSKFLRDNNIHAKSYHGGLTAKDRKRTQDMFCSNKLRVVVATVAFGMGLNKSDVEAVIHYSLPGSLEHYVQETGRAGRDGRLAYCHLFLEDTTYFKIRSLAYSDGADEYAIDKFLFEVFSYMKKPSRVCSLNISTSSRNFDLKEEVMDTILSFLEIEEVQYLHVLPQLNATCSLSFHKNSPNLLAKKSMLIDALLKRIQSKHGHYVFDIPSLANDTGLEVAYMLKELEKLQFLGEISYEMKDPAFCYIPLKVPEDICSLTKSITSRLAEVEVSKIQKIDAMYTAAMNAVKYSKQYDGSGISLQHSYLQRITEDYFNSENCLDATLSNRIQVSSPFLRADIKVLLQSNTHLNFTPRAVARVMHGISSPAYPSAVWSKNHFWGRYSKVDFNVVKEAATSELLAFRGWSRNSRPIT
ncbi:ATP-dependent DNA helicase Q-like 5 isoform X1 [Cryptomeria japonica]|uniref:ATP-dependent DNA helicase Q-like 5 isoform X1 n=1 Tax=Cryptomeria japonica TaxID=3369 RepID=UPI0025AC12B5|nr:ATP-dependent DNA helicase Q-like 5 isoform X1 [Cryptomeria japonica]XP_057852290.1 ATP-dependent DNA helicase Q-like 5 isoform X1 [Cryptomeria japonica]XP_057852291.1 ATP-dependent DNA helicase Q-like 5 isoform X1 [Cryptomeria japonica]